MTNNKTTNSDLRTSLGVRKVTNRNRAMAQHVAQLERRTARFEVGRFLIAAGLALALGVTVRPGHHGTLTQCDLFDISSTSHWTGAAIIVQCSRMKAPA